MIGSGLAGASAAASIGAMGYNVECFCFQDSPRRAHSIAAQGGINASKNYRNDGDSTWRLFYDTQKGGDYRAREKNVYRLAELSTAIIDQAVSQGVPFAREYGGKLANRSFGGVLVERTFYCRGETGQQLLLGAYSALEEQIAAKNVTMHTRTELLDVVVIDGKTRGVVVRNLETGEIKSHAADAVVLASGGYGNVYYLSTNAKGCNVTANFRAYRRGAGFANPCFTQIHPTSIPASGKYQSKLTLMSESLRNDGRIWVPRDPDEKRAATDIPEDERYYYLEERYPRFGNLVPRDVAARNAKDVCDKGLGVGPTGYGVYLDFAAAIEEKGMEAVKSKYANLFEMYQRITNDDPTETPMRIYPAVHYTMGGLWVDYNLMTNVPGLTVTLSFQSRLATSSAATSRAKSAPTILRSKKLKTKPRLRSIVCFRSAAAVPPRSSTVSWEKLCGSTAEFLVTQNRLTRESRRSQPFVRNSGATSGFPEKPTNLTNRWNMLAE